MPTISAISLSGMHAAQSALGASAHNVANLATPGFRRMQAVQTTVDTGGVRASFQLSPAAGHAPEADLVGQLQAKHQFLANLSVFKTGDQMMGSLLDAVG